MGKCCLCGAEPVKLVKSHIIPRSLYGDVINGEEGPAKLVPHDTDKHPKRSPMGVYDDSILCEQCEAKLSPLDDYANEIFRVAEPAPLIVDGEQVGVQITGIDQKKLKQFFISLIWRMHITQHDFFQNVDLGPLEPKFREAILKGDPDLVSHVDVVVSRFDHEAAAAFVSPHKMTIDQCNGYRVFFAQHACWVKVDSQPFPKPFRAMALNQNDTLIMLLRDFEDSPELKALVETLRRRAQ